MFSKLELLKDVPSFSPWYDPAHVGDWTPWFGKQPWQEISKKDWMQHVGHAELYENTIHGDIDALVSVISVPLP